MLDRKITVHATDNISQLDYFSSGQSLSRNRSLYSVLRSRFSNPDCGLRPEQEESRRFLKQFNRWFAGFLRTLRARGRPNRAGARCRPGRSGSSMVPASFTPKKGIPAQSPAPPSRQSCMAVQIARATPPPRLNGSLSSRPSIRRTRRASKAVARWRRSPVIPASAMRSVALASLRIT